jgi:hypothetical protein
MGRRGCIITHHDPLYPLYRTKYRATEEVLGNIYLEYLVIDYREFLKNYRPIGRRTSGDH